MLGKDLMLSFRRKIVTMYHSSPVQKLFHRSMIPLTHPHTPAAPPAHPFFSSDLETWSVQVVSLSGRSRSLVSDLVLRVVSTQVYRALILWLMADSPRTKSFSHGVTIPAILILPRMSIVSHMVSPVLGVKFSRQS